MTTPAPRDLPTYSIKVGGAALAKTYQVLSVRVQKEVNRIPTAHLLIKDGDAAAGDFLVSNQELFVPGKALEIWAGYQGIEKIIFKGLVVKHGIEALSSGSTRLKVVCKDALVKTTLTARQRYFTNKKDSEAAEEIGQSYADLAIEAEATAFAHPELIQYDTTDWDYVVMRAEANGQLCFVDDGKLTIAKPNFDQKPVLGLQFGATMLAFEAEMDARDQVLDLKTVAWNPADLATVETEATEPNWAEQGNLSAKTVAEALSASPLLQHAGQLPPEELQTWADAALLKRRLAKIRGRVQCYGNGDLKPGDLIELSGVGERFNGQVLVTGVSHRLENGQWLTDTQFGLNPRWFVNEFTVSSPAASGLRPMVSGLQIGVVTGLAGDPSGEERMLVRLPAISSSDEGTYARVVSLDAGSERGFFFRPEIGDEVVVGFVNNDPSNPIVLGALHSSKHPAPIKADEANPLKGYVSRSKMKLTFDDEKKTMTLETPAGNLLKLDEDEKSLTIQDQNGNKIILNDQGITIDSSKDLILKAANDVTMDGLNISQTASAQFKASGSAGLEVSSSAVATVKGSLVQIN